MSNKKQKLFGRILSNDVAEGNIELTGQMTSSAITSGEQELIGELLTNSVVLGNTSSNGKIITTMIAQKGANGNDGEDGKSLEFNWDGTKLGIREEGTQEYTYVDLKGATGEKGTTGDTGNGISSITLTSTSGKVKTYTITFTNGTTTTFQVIDGNDGINGTNGINGVDGNDATINGVNTLTIEAGDNIIINQVDDVLTISGEGTDLTDYVKNTDYASGSKGGVFKTSSNFATTVTSGGYLVNGAKTYNEYQNANVNMFVSKGTLDNVITGKNLVSDADYVHTDNNFDDFYMDKLDYIDIEGSGESFLADDGAYYPLNFDIRIPEIKIKSITVDGEKYLRLVFGAYSKAFEDYVANNGISIHLLRYKNCSRREWNEIIKTKEKKWMHPSNAPTFNTPDKQCWGFACYQQFMSQDDYHDQIENADYYIANNGMVQSEYGLTYSNFKKGYLDINVRDLMSCIVKRGGHITFEDTDMKIPTYGDEEPVKIMGTRTSPRRKRVRQPIKYVFALPIRISSGRIKYQYGTSNEAILELMTLRDQQAMKGYSGGDKLLDDIGFGVLIK